MKKWILSKKSFGSRLIFDPVDFLLLFASFFALLLAYSSEFFWGLKPCILCLYQRVPFFVIIFSVCARVFTKYKRFFFFIYFLSLSLCASIAFYHAGLEYKIFPDLLKCSQLPAFNSIKEAESLLMGKDSVLNMPSCDKPQFVIFGVSMAGMNFLYCTFLIIISLYLNCANKKKE